MASSEVEAMIKSCVLSKKGDMTISELQGEYFQLVGEHIPYKRLGCESLEDFLNKLSGISTKKNPRGQLIVVACSQKAAHIAELVNKQKTVPKRFHKVKGRIVCSPRKPVRAPARNAPRNSLCNQTVQSKGNSSQQSRNRSAGNNLPKFSHDATLNKKSASKIPPVNRRRVSYTQVRYTAAGEEFSEDSCDEEFDCPSAGDDSIRNGFAKPFGLEKSIAEGGLNGAIKARKSYVVDNGSVNGPQRIVSMTGSTLMCTVSVRPSQQSRNRIFPSVHAQEAVDCHDNALGNAVEDYEYYSSSEIVSSPGKGATLPLNTGHSLPVAGHKPCPNNFHRSTLSRGHQWDNGPVMLGYSLVGDDFLLQFAYECLHVDCEWEDEERLSCGMCISGQTIHDFHMQVRHEGFIQPKMVLMLGAVDILQGNPVEQIIEDTKQLLEDIISSPVKSLVFLTLPFLKNGGMANRKIVIINEFLKTLDDGYHIKVLDTYTLFNKKGHMRERIYENCMNYKCYESFTRDILCYPQGVVLWSHIGRSYLYNFLLQELTELHNTTDYLQNNM